MSSDHLSWSPVASTEIAMILVFRLSNSGWSRAMVPSSVVQTGVKSFGCENSTAQPSPIHSWKRIGPWVVMASKSGAMLLICNAMTSLPLLDRQPQAGAHRQPQDYAEIRPVSRAAASVCRTTRYRFCVVPAPRGQVRRVRRYRGDQQPHVEVIGPITHLQHQSKTRNFPPAGRQYLMVP